MGTKICSVCGKEKPIELFVKNSKYIDGYAAHCKECHNRKYGKKRIKDTPVVSDSVLKECDSHGLDKVPARLLISELRRRGYSGKLQLITIQDVVI